MIHVPLTPLIRGLILSSVLAGCALPPEAPEESSREELEAAREQERDALFAERQEQRRRDAAAYAEQRRQREEAEARQERAQAERVAQLAKAPPKGVLKLVPVAERMARTQGAADLATMCGLRSTAWRNQVTMIVGLAYEQHVASKLSEDERALLRRLNRGNDKVRADYPQGAQGCVKLGRSQELADIDSLRREATFNYH